MVPRNQGDNLGSHGLVQKGGPTEESVRILLIVRWPGLDCKPHVVQEQVASLVDVAPPADALGPDHTAAHARA